MLTNTIFSLEDGTSNLLQRAESVDLTKYYYAGDDAQRLQDDYKAKSPRDHANGKR